MTDWNKDNYSTNRIFLEEDINHGFSHDKKHAYLLPSHKMLYIRAISLSFEKTLWSLASL